MTPAARPALRVVAAGFHPAIQDLGRWGSQNLGVPVSGALDPVALRLANAVVGNPQGEAAIEIRLIGPTFEVEADSARVALVGTEAEIELLDPAGRAVPAGRATRLARGSRFRVGAIRDTACAYLAVEGGFDLPAPFGSRSTYARSGIGGFEGRALRDGDRLPLARAAASAAADLVLPALPAALYGDGAARVVPGPQDGHFTAAAMATFLSSAYEVGREADRMGLRLEGPELEHARGFNIVSDGIANGAIQVPGTRKPIILLADHQTSGGYPKIATVISADLPRIGRLRPGARITFRAVGIEEAEAALREREAALAAVARGLHAVGETPHLNESALHRVNLVSGAVRARTLPGI